MTKLKADCTVEEWSAIRVRARGYDSKQRQKPERKKYMQRYLHAYTKTPAYRAWDNSRYGRDARKKQTTSAFRQRTYGLSEGQFTTLLAFQDCKCAVCGRPFSHANRFTKEVVDHCHAGAQVRGLLCAACNLAEGYIKKTGLSPASFGEKLAAYLDNPPMRIVELVV